MHFCEAKQSLSIVYRLSSIVYRLEQTIKCRQPLANIHSHVVYCLSYFDSHKGCLSIAILFSFVHSLALALLDIFKLTFIINIGSNSNGGKLYSVVDDFKTNWLAHTNKYQEEWFLSLDFVLRVKRFNKSNKRNRVELNSYGWTDFSIAQRRPWAGSNRA